MHTYIHTYIVHTLIVSVIVRNVHKNISHIWQKSYHIISLLDYFIPLHTYIHTYIHILRSCSLPYFVGDTYIAYSWKFQIWIHTYVAVRKLNMISSDKNIHTIHTRTYSTYIHTPTTPTHLPMTCEIRSVIRARVDSPARDLLFCQKEMSDCSNIAERYYYASFNASFNTWSKNVISRASVMYVCTVYMPVCQKLYGVFWGPRGCYIFFE